MEKKIGLPNELYTELETILVDLGFFDSDHDLRALFIDDRIAGFENNLIESNSKLQRIRQTVHYFYQKNKLLDFLNVLVDRISTRDLDKEVLTNIVNKVEHVLELNTKERTCVPSSDEHEIQDWSSNSTAQFDVLRESYGEHASKFIQILAEEVSHNRQDKFPKLLNWILEISQNSTANKEINKKQWLCLALEKHIEFLGVIEMDPNGHIESYAANFLEHQVVEVRKPMFKLTEYQEHWSELYPNHPMLNSSVECFVEINQNVDTVLSFIGKYVRLSEVLPDSLFHQGIETDQLTKQSEDLLDMFTRELPRHIAMGGVPREVGNRIDEMFSDWTFYLECYLDWLSELSDDIRDAGSYLNV